MSRISKTSIIVSAVIILLSSFSAAAKQYHVSPQGSDTNTGSKSAPFKTISAAANIAQPGDTITVYAGTYREQINPPRGGTSETNRITYQAAKGQKVTIKGSEPIKGWKKIKENTWKVTIPNTFFGNFNPYKDLIAGDWFGPLGREYHTGAVYLNNHWLVEAINLDDVLKPIGNAGDRYVASANQCLLNIASFKTGPEDSKNNVIAADKYSKDKGIKTEPCSKGGKCIAWIEHGNWVCYDNVDFGTRCTEINFLAASGTPGGFIEIRLDGPEGELIGSCTVTYTSGWQNWKNFKAKIKPTSGPKNICLVFKGARDYDPSKLRLWFADVNETTTTIWAQFKDINPNNEQVEINTRQSVFYPKKTGINYITIKGFNLMHAATPWAPPTAEQIGLIGTNWSKYWIIEDNEISYSTCVGVTLGKYGDKWDNKSQDSAEGYVETINRALKNGWSKENIGHHIVRNNHISHCEQAGIVGSLGAVFSQITNNTIHDIHVRRLFGGAEMAGIKIHASIDTLIKNNYIHHCEKGIWLDWMAQGTRVTSNLLHDNITMDLFMEVDHGPYTVDNNIFLSSQFLWDWSQGGCFAHNLAKGKIYRSPQDRQTPYHSPHSTHVAALHNIPGGDNRFYNNIFITTKGMDSYKDAKFPVFVDGNIYLSAATAYPNEKNNINLPNFDPNPQIIQKKNTTYLQLTLPKMDNLQTQLITTEMLGKTKISNAPFENYDATPLKIDTDYQNKKRNPKNPTPGPFKNYRPGKKLYKVN